jgi:hypothetical protein
MILLNSAEPILPTGLRGWLRSGPGFRGYKSSIGITSGIKLFSNALLYSS